MLINSRGQPAAGVLASGLPLDGKVPNIAKRMRTLSVAFGDSSPKGRAKQADNNCPYNLQLDTFNL